MTPEEEQAVAYHVRELAKLLYKDADASQMPMTNLGKVEATVREQVQKHVTPEMDIFYRNSYGHNRRVPATAKEHFRTIAVDQRTSQSIGGRQREPVESLSGDVLSENQCECVLCSCHRRCGPFNRSPGQSKNSATPGATRLTSGWLGCWRSQRLP